MVSFVRDGDDAAHSSVADLRIDGAAPGRSQEAQRVTSEQQDAVDKCPFFRFHPFVVFVIVCVVQERIKSCNMSRPHRITRGVNSHIKGRP